MAGRVVASESESAEFFESLLGSNLDAGLLVGRDAKIVAEPAAAPCMKTKW